jgi:hypothetical protein
MYEGLPAKTIAFGPDGTGYVAGKYGPKPVENS